jgi:hypothetical protein
MKKIVLLFSFIFLNICADAQVSIGKKQTNSSGLLDFAEDSSKGIILPLVESMPANPSQGTFLAYKVDSSVYVFSDSKWVKLASNGLNPTTFMNYNGSEMDSTILGSKTSSASGVLVLESVNKALILPKNTSPHLTMSYPRIGTMCYDKTNKSIAIYDGKKWMYWR